MTSPVFVTFTDLAGSSIRISSQASISMLTPVTTGLPASIAAATVITFDGGGSVVVQGSVTTTATALGVTSPTGPGVLCNTPQGTVALSAYGTDAASTADTWYWSEGYNPAERLVTNILMLNGTTVGTDKAIYAVWNSAGTPVGWTALAGVLCATGDIFQGIAAVTPFTLPAGQIWSGFVVNGTNTAHQTIATATYPNYTGTTAGTFGAAVPSITPTTTTTAGVGPFWRMS